MKPKNTLCIAEWQSFGFNEVKQALEANHKINATLNNSNAEWSETKATITSEAKAIESKAQSIFNELVDFTKYEGNHQFLKLIRQNGKDMLKAQNYVGLIQSKSGFCVEILPKTFQSIKESNGFQIKNCTCSSLQGSETDKTIQNNVDCHINTSPHNENLKSQKCKVCQAKQILLNMLKSLKNSPLKHTQFAHLKAQQFPLLEAFVLMFLDELESLVKRGIRANYVLKEQNRTFLKGKLLFSQHLKYNLTHKERFFTASDEFSHNIPENALIKSTLKLLETLSLSSKTQSKLIQMHFIFAEIKPSKNIDKDLSRCQNTRHFKVYENILLWCKIFLKRQSFSAYQGNSKAFALLFDMNILFESYVASEMKKYLNDKSYKNGLYDEFVQHILKDSQSDIQKHNIFIKTQESIKYLAEQDKEKMFRLIPDIVGYTKDNIQQTPQTFFIADTKWKLLSQDSQKHYNIDNIAQADIYQIWAYPCKYQCKKGFLIYPAPTDSTETNTKPTPPTFTFKSDVVAFAKNLSEGSKQVTQADSQNQPKITLYICLFPLSHQ
ncbi:McrC family protein [uncultured Helicobacter sp.]|uniref:McrC family protein n=1 Tax=uncultured Helicobacter sp. TaxID=175537 RepID=UPI00260BC352|nr:McrC family protein [uncultured Helicobacter sp.]